MSLQNPNRSVQILRENDDAHIFDDPMHQNIPDIVFERPIRKSFTFLNFVNPLWMISSLARTIFRLLGFRKSPRPRELQYLSNGLPEDYVVLRYPLKYSLHSIIPELDGNGVSRDTKCTQTDLENYIQSKLSSQLEQLVSVRRFRNALKPSRKRVRKIMSKNTDSLLRGFNERNHERYGGKISKTRRLQNDRLTRSLRMVKSNTKTIDVDNALEDVFYVTDSDN